jgi:drug/metabolite transporter (DMT)-like permease
MPRCTKKHATGQTLNKLVSKGRYRVFHVLSGLCYTAFGIFLGVVPFALTILHGQKILTERISDFHSLVFIGLGLFFIILGVSSWYDAIFK